MHIIKGIGSKAQANELRYTPESAFRRGFLYAVGLQERNFV